MSIESPEYHREVWNDAHPIPDFRIPVGWYENQSMANHNRTQVSLRSADWGHHIDINAVPRQADIPGPYWLELREQIGGDASFETRTVEQLTGIEPGAIQDAVYRLVGVSLGHEFPGGDSG